MYLYVRQFIHNLAILIALKHVVNLVSSPCTQLYVLFSTVLSLLCEFKYHHSKPLSKLSNQRSTFFGEHPIQIWSGFFNISMPYSTLSWGGNLLCSSYGDKNIRTGRYFVPKLPIGTFFDDICSHRFRNQEYRVLPIFFKKYKKYSRVLTGSVSTIRSQLS